MFFGQFRQVFRQSEQEGEPQQAQKPPESQKSSTPEEFIKSPEAKEFVRDWSSKLRDGKLLYTKRGITLLLRLLYPNFENNKKILAGANELLKTLGGMDGLTGFLMGWKAKSEGIMKGIKNLFGG